MYNQLYNQLVAEIKNEIKNINIPSPAVPDIDFTPLVKQISEQKILYKLLADQINTMNEIISTIARELSQQKGFTVDIAHNIADKIELLNDNYASIKTIAKEIDLLRNDSMERFSYIDDKLSSTQRQLAASNDRTEGDLIALHDIVTVMNQRIAELNEKIDSLQNTREYIKGDIKEDIKDIKEEFAKIVVQNALDRQVLVEEIAARTMKQVKSLLAKKTKVEVSIKVKKRKSRKMIRKLKIKVAKRKIVKRKIVRKIKVRKIKKPVVKIMKGMIRGKLKRYGIVDYGNALVVTERNMQKYGRAVFDIARKMNGNTIMIMQEKMSEEDGFDQTTYDAMDNSEAVFIVTNRNMKRNFAVKNAALRKRVFVVDKKLKFSEVKY
jgi:DNA-binding transcriptional MerR regulator